MTKGFLFENIPIPLVGATQATELFDRHNSGTLKISKKELFIKFAE